MRVLLRSFPKKLDQPKARGYWLVTMIYNIITRMFSTLPELNLYSIGAPALFLAAVILSVFLYWRAGKYEYIESGFLLDNVIIAGVGAFVFSRLFDYLFNFQNYGLSFGKLVFFNSFGGFDIWGALFGGILSLYLFLKRKKNIFLTFVDLSAAPIVFGLFVYSLSNLRRGIYDALAYLVLFVIIKRLEQKKRRRGFFACFSVVSVSIINLIFYKPHAFWDYQLIKPLGFLVFGVAVWYFLSKRSFAKDIKSVLGSFLLLGFGMKRIVSSLQEADKFSKNIIFSPFYFGKAVFIFVRMLAREIYLSMTGLMNAFRLKK